MDDFAVARTKMVDSQLRTESVTDYEILSVMGRIPREPFVPPHQRALAYLDTDIPITSGAGGAPRYLMEAAPFARLLQLSEVEKNDVVLDIGCGTGYSAAVIAGLANFVVALESDEGLAAQAKENLAALGVDNAKVVIGPLDAGHPLEGPYDVILLDGAVEMVPAALFGQLKEGGRLAAVVGYGRAATAMLYKKSDHQIGKRTAFNADVRPLPGFRKPEAFVF
jgi:protein-L-isoaspartate(D-aspartate) O-methyltransferase